MSSSSSSIFALTVLSALSVATLSAAVPLSEAQSPPQSSQQSSPQSSPQSSSSGQWKLTWSDEFNGRARSAVDRTKWTLEKGGQGGGDNGERQYNSTDRKNAYHDGKGNLVITAMKQKVSQKEQCWYGKCAYSSARMITQGKHEQHYGKIEIRTKLPVGKGMWPAFWMLGNDIDNKDWPACGEIDVMEHIGKEPSTVYGVLHGPGYSGEDSVGGTFKLPDGKKFSEDFHTFAIEWEPNEVRWYVDGKEFQRKTPSDLSGGEKWVFDHPFFMILNLAVGGGFPGDPDATTRFPQKMVIDYVRVYER